MALLVAGGRIRLESGFHLVAIAGVTPLTAVSADGRRVEVDELAIAMGFRPDPTPLRELRVALDPALECPPALAPLIDPSLQSCGTVRPHGVAELAYPEPDFYVAGMKSCGRAPTSLLATGHKQVRSIVAVIAGDHAAASRVELLLPETGVCSGPGSRSVQLAAACCGGPALTRSYTCCAEDEPAKDGGASGCGCSATAGPVKVAECC